MELREKAEKLAKRPYFLMTSVEETTDGHQIYFARVLEIDGCFGQGETRDQALEDLSLAMVDFIQSLLEDGLPVPDPTTGINTTVGTTAGTTLAFIGQRENYPKKHKEIYRATAGATFTFVNQGEKLRQKQNETSQHSFGIPIHVG